MKTHARVVIVGGGVVGVNILYSLAKAGWKEVVLVERRELTSGSTWHAAGLIPLYSMSHPFGRIIKNTIELYETLEQETGQAVGWHKCGQLRLAATKDRLDEYRRYATIAPTVGVRAEVIGPREVKRLWPLVEKLGDLEGALFHPDDGHIAPADVTQALAKGARDLGAEIYRQTEVVGIERTPTGEWKIKTDRGDIVGEHVVTATGSFARQTGAMVGLDLPVIPVVHQYLVTEEVPGIVARHAAGEAEMPVLRDEVMPGYIREERQGLMIGPYDQDPPLYAVDGVPPGYEGELLPPDIERLEAYLERAIERVPAAGEVGVRSCVTGPIAIAPDNLPLAGPAWGLRNFWLAEGMSGGVLMGGGIAHHLAAWIMDGEPGADLHEIDPRRFGPYATKAYACVKAKEVFAANFGINYPDWEWPGGRPAKTVPCHDRLTRAGAVWGSVYGWEVANWFAPPGVEPIDRPGFRRTNHFEHVGNECRAVRERVGLYDITNIAKYEVCGPGAEAYLDRLLANRLPEIGAIALCHALTPSGRVMSEFTVTRLAADHFYLVGSGMAERHDFDTLSKALPPGGDVDLRNVTTNRGGFVVAGPLARALLAPLTNRDLSSEAFPWQTAQVGTVGLAPDIRLLRLNYVGELGWELHHPIEHQNQLFDAIVEAGKEFGLCLVGNRAVESLRLEKSYRALWRDLNTEYTALEAGLDRFVRLNKGDFVGRDALVRQQEQGLRRRLSVLEMESGGTDPFRNEAVYNGSGEVVGRVTSAAYGHRLGRTLAHAYLGSDYATTGTELHVAVLDERRAARVIDDSPYDPENARPRG